MPSRIKATWLGPSRAAHETTFGPFKGHNADLAANWTDLYAAWTWRWTAYVNWDVSAALDSLIAVLRAAGTVITIVIEVVTAFG